LVAALGSYLHSKSRGGEWLLRIEDLDTPRNQPGAVDAILRSLSELGLHPDGEIVYQTERRHAYLEAIAALEQARQLYPCACSRAEIGDRPYPGTCRDGIRRGRRGRALRLRVGEEPIGFTDALQGPFQQALASEVGDFIVRRADNIIAYHLAVVVDDTAQGITEVVRGADLLDSTPRQIHLQKLLGIPTPAYLHLPVAIDTDGRKLSKQNGAPALDTLQPVHSLFHALRFLGQAPPQQLKHAAAATVLEWAIEHWAPARIPAVPSLRPDFD
jgi:glutamyl-Q tRNA(Asp) synthetase